MAIPRALAALLVLVAQLVVLAGTGAPAAPLTRAAVRPSTWLSIWCPGPGMCGSPPKRRYCFAPRLDGNGEDR